jgi:hypothetical protein
MGKIDCDFTNYEKPLLKKIEDQIYKNHQDMQDVYIIGAHEADGKRELKNVIRHEFSHAMFYLSEEYRASCNHLLKTTNKEIVEAKRWFQMKDFQDSEITLYEPLNKGEKCIVCEKEMKEHGKMSLPDNSYDIICPGDWLLKYSNGKIYSCDHNTFIQVYEELE